MTTKNEITEAVRQLLLSQPGIAETTRADAGQTTISYQSLSMSERHVWLDTDLGGRMVVDLEDWSASSKWDNAVAHIVVLDTDLLARVAFAWLTGRPVKECKEIGGVEIHLR